MVGRDEKGKFKKGEYRGGPGRPKKNREDRFYEILVTTVTNEDWIEIIKRAMFDAKRGDTSARTWLSNYYAGPPVERKEISGIDAGPIVLKVIYDD
jgi:hypothetical protein